MVEVMHIYIIQCLISALYIILYILYWEETENIIIHQMCTKSEGVSLTCNPCVLQKQWHQVQNIYIHIILLIINYETRHQCMYSDVCRKNTYDTKKKWVVT